MRKFELFILGLVCVSLSCCDKKAPPALITPSFTNKSAVLAKAQTGAIIKIACEGTSLTYGEDIGGTDTISAPPGDVNFPTRAIYQYPSTLAATITNAKVVISMRGYPGDRTTEGLIRWKDSTSTDICIIEYGSNDAYNFAGYASGAVPVAVYKTQLEQLVQRRLNQGAWVMLCLSPYLSNGDTTITAYRNAAASVANEFSLETFDIQASIAQLQSPYSDLVHLNSMGYRKWGVDIAALFYQL
jgi:lysophospholipase L1-like esterase